MENRLSRKTKLFYGVAGIGDSALYSMMGMFALFFFTTVAGINPAAAGTIVAVGAVWDVVSGSIVGYISDRTNGKKLSAYFKDLSGVYKQKDTPAAADILPHLVEISEELAKDSASESSTPAAESSEKPSVDPKTSTEPMAMPS